MPCKVPSALCDGSWRSSSVSLTVGKDKDVTGKFYKYVSITEKSLHVKFEKRLEIIASFDTEGKNC